MTLHLKRLKFTPNKKNTTRQLNSIQIVINEHGSDILGDNALLNLAIIYDKNLNNIDEAKRHYEKFIENYGSSIFINEVRKRYRFLRGDILN
jgi:tetratricopeptide (TPR) repeat protein